MPSTATNVASTVNEAYSRIGEYITDDSRVPYYNPSDSGVDILPGEPVVVQFGASGGPQVMMATDIIRPGKIGMLVRYFTADLPCNLSANVVLGDELMWDIDNDVLSLAADVTNGFVVGNASYPISSNSDEMEAPTVDGNDRVICGGTSSTRIRVISKPNQTVTTKGTVPEL
jgi:hypothetical protein